MASGKLFTYPGNFRAFKALIAAEYSGAKVSVDTSFKFGDTNKSSAFLSKFPLGKVPAFEASNGDCIFESNAIAHYVGNDQLLGKTQADAARIQQWINFGDNEILPASCTWVFPCLGITQFNKQDTEKAKEQIQKALSVLNSHLKTRTYLVGERITQADIAVACDLLLAYQYVLDPSVRGSYVNVNRWFTTLINQPNFKKVIGDFKLCDKMATFDAKKYSELHGLDKKKKDEKPAKQKKEQPKQQPKQEKKKEPEDDDEPPKPKEDKDPWATVPKTSFDFDAFKRTYSNNDTIEVAVPYFWEKFDKENMSIWHCEYLYPDELKMIFMTCNLVGGMMQRLEKLRKFAFGSMCILGQDNSNQISGLWFWRGQDLAFPLSPDWQIDYESYKWTKLNPDDEKTKKMVKEYFAWEGDFDGYGGKKFNQGKIYK
ncbi:elongation factor 1-gamma-like [Ruditapes philippinarum]|uniref:elongation factor 1-gamma-like n=1 Tax=Ruditapes philippinarum TaxID=129788 RepID=UPI00295A6C9D|nr:elongation factor 1-gamma-like [Ruditapes philippinarum]